MTAAKAACRNNIIEIQKEKAEKGGEIKGFSRPLRPQCKEELETGQIILEELRFRREDLGSYNSENAKRCSKLGDKWLEKNESMNRNNQSINYRCYYGTLESNPGRVEIEKIWTIWTNFKY